MIGGISMSIRTFRAAAAFVAIVSAGALVGCVQGGKESGQSVPFTDAAVTSPNGRDYSVNWTATGAAAVAVYAGTDPAHIGRDHPVGQGPSAGSVSVADLPAAPRWYFELVPDRGAPLVVADRSLHLASAPNFRDAGGYRADDGKWVRMGLLYRSDQLDRLTPADLETLHGDNIHLVCDLRTDVERKQGQDRLPAGAQPMIADVAGGDSSSSGLAKLLGSGGDPEAILGHGRGAQLMIDANHQFVTSQAARTAYKALFERLADPTMLPATFHCTAGKDRTGWAEAVFLSIMGVPRDVIMRDYLLSNGFLEAKNQRTLQMMKGHMDPALFEPLFGVRPEYLQAGFDAVDKTYGSMDRYVREGLGLSDATIQSLRREFLAG
jgi:protein-tyrosine phosphatase